MSKAGWNNDDLAHRKCSGLESEDTGGDPAALEVPKADFLLVEVRDGPEKGGGAVDQMELEEGGGVACTV